MKRKKLLCVLEKNIVKSYIIRMINRTTVWSVNAEIVNSKSNKSQTCQYILKLCKPWKYGGLAKKIFYRRTKVILFKQPSKFLQKVIILFRFRCRKVEHCTKKCHLMCKSLFYEGHAGIASFYYLTGAFVVVFFI